jgi:nucleoside-diphosphate-sugar epimerase
MNHPLEFDLREVMQHTRDLWEPLRGKAIFITGGTGFVGTWLTETLCWADTQLKLGIRITLLTRNPEAFRLKAATVANHPAVTFIRGEAKTFDFPSGEFQFVIHAATEAHRSPSNDAPDETFSDDLAATKHVLEFARRAGTRRFLFTSSGAVYGTQPSDLPAISEDYIGAPSPTNVRSAYGQAKRASEFLCAMYARQFGFNALIARLFAFIGPHLPSENFAAGNFVKNVVDGKPIRIEGDGSTVRSYLYASDMAIWLWTILLKGESLRPYNVGGADPLTIRELAERIAGISGIPTPVEILGRTGVPATRYIPDTSRARTELKLAETISIDEGLRRMLAWYRSRALEMKHS